MRRLAQLIGQAVPWRLPRAATDGAWNETGSLPASPLQRSSGAVPAGAISSGVPDVDFPKPLHTEWAWRPEPWSVPVRPSGVEACASGAPFGTQAKLFHDCRLGTCSVRQLGVSDGPTRFALNVETHEFDGDFLSIAIDLPEEAVAKLTRNRLLRVAVQCKGDRPAMFVRLNLRSGPNMEHLVQRLDDEYDTYLDLDLAEVNGVEDGVASAWVDVIFETPRLNCIRLNDLTFTLRPRAAY